MPRTSVHLAVALVMSLGACFSPDVTEGLACSVDGECPPGQFCDVDGFCRASATPDIDASSEDDIDASEDGAPTPAAFCDPNDNPGLVGCYMFNGSADDLSGLDHHPQFDNQAYANGIDGQAFVFTDATVMVVPENEDFDAGELTVEMWIRPDVIGVADVNLLDNDSQYELELTAAETVRARCSVSGANSTLTGTTVIAADEFTHVALTYNGASLLLYVGGVEDASVAAPGALDEAGIMGTFVGLDHALNEQFNGRIDNFRVFDVARTPEQICVSAGMNDC
jgi:hypothetical protein